VRDVPAEPSAMARSEADGFTEDPRELQAALSRIAERLQQLERHLQAR
jgi:hypothetical protein